jgi:hypothetical protein
VNYGLPIFVVLLTAMEAGVPIPVPSDVLLLVLGERVSAGRFPLLLVVVALELVVAVGTAALFFLAGGPDRRCSPRWAPESGSLPSAYSGPVASWSAAVPSPWR